MRHQKLGISELTVGRIIGGDPEARNVYFLDPTNGSDGNDGKAITRAKKNMGRSTRTCKKF